METTKLAAKTVTVVATAKASPKFKTFSKAIEAAGLQATFEGVGPFTVFAPTDEAFGKLPSGKLDTLFKMENKGELAGILRQHVVGGKTMSTAAKTMEVKTLAGSARQLKVEGSKVFIDDGQVTQADIACSNGVIHAIDKVMLPPQKK